MSKPVLELKDVSVHFHNGPAGVLRALHQVSLTLERGEILAIVGECGSGRSTLAEVLDLLWGGEETLVVVELPPEARLVASDELHFTGLGTSNPRLRLPSGEEYVGRYEESVGDLLVMKPGEDGAQLVGKSETRLIFRRADARAR